MHEAVNARRAVASSKEVSVVVLEYRNTAAWQRASQHEHKQAVPNSHRLSSSIQMQYVHNATCELHQIQRVK